MGAPFILVTALQMSITVPITGRIKAETESVTNDVIKGTDFLVRENWFWF